MTAYSIPRELHVGKLSYQNIVNDLDSHLVSNPCVFVPNLSHAYLFFVGALYELVVSQLT